MSFWEIFLAVLFIVVWLLLTRFVFPKLGIPT